MSKSPDMQAIILVGGLGTRLRAVLRDLPKPMAPIGDKPFLAYLLHYLKKQGITQVVFPVHYLSEKIQTYFQSQYEGITIQYVEEAQPLGTGGAMINALAILREAREPIFVLNGDTFAKLDYQDMLTQHRQNRAALTMALRPVQDCSRYGKVMTEDNRIIAFKEKGESGPGLINAGVYLINPNLFSSFSLPPRFSFENDFMFSYLEKLSPQAFITDDYFIDIGIPEDYSRAMNELPLMGV
jgi:D-glycero-alpha-D-manno-heptose 1-phosphate guanylyltransferase